jgi:hypothetical protein
MTKLSSVLSFNESWKSRVHIAQITFTILAIFLSVGRAAIRNPPATRANTVDITMVGLYLLYLGVTGTSPI